MACWRCLEEDGMDYQEWWFIFILFYFILFFFCGVYALHKLLNSSAL